MTPRPKHDYDLIAEILKDKPDLEKSAARLAREYTARHPEHLRMSANTLRWILQNHGAEILGRPYRPGASGRPVEHDYEAIRAIVRDEPPLFNQPLEVARRYRERTGRRIHRIYVQRLLREWEEEILADAPQVPGEEDDEYTPVGRVGTPERSAAIDRFGEVLRIYRGMDPREADALRAGWSAVYADILADGIHWAQLNGITVEAAMCSAWETVALEKAK